MSHRDAACAGSGIERAGLRVRHAREGADASSGTGQVKGVQSVAVRLEMGTETLRALAPEGPLGGGRIGDIRLWAQALPAGGRRPRRPALARPLRRCAPTTGAPGGPRPPHRPPTAQLRTAAASVGAPFARQGCPCCERQTTATQHSVDARGRAAPSSALRRASRRRHSAPGHRDSPQHYAPRLR